MMQQGSRPRSRIRSPFLPATWHDASLRYGQPDASAASLVPQGHSGYSATIGIPSWQLSIRESASAATPRARPSSAANRMLGTLSASGAASASSQRHPSAPGAILPRCDVGDRRGGEGAHARIPLITVPDRHLPLTSGYSALICVPAMGREPVWAAPARIDRDGQHRSGSRPPPRCTGYRFGGTVSATPHTCSHRSKRHPMREWTGAGLTLRQPCSTPSNVVRAATCCKC